MTKKLPEAGNVTAETASAPVNGEGVPVVANAKLAGAKVLKSDASAKKVVKAKAEGQREEESRDDAKVAEAEQLPAQSDGSFKLAMADNGVMSDALGGMGAAADGEAEGEGQDAPAAGGAAAPAAAASGGGGSSLPYILGGIAVAGGVGAAAASGGGSKETPAPQIPPTYAVSVDKQNANEGDTLRFTVSGTNAKPGDVVSYQIAGISAEDLSSGSLTGSVTLDASLRAFVDVAVARDAKTEGVENLRMVLGQGASVNVTVADTSVDPVYTLTSDKPNANEGDTVRFTVKGSADAKPGDVITYQITGVEVEDLASGSLTGQFVLGQNREAFVDIALSADAKTEGVQNLVMTLGTGGATTVVVADTSRDQTVDFTTGTDLLVGDKAGSADDNVYVGRAGSTFFASGSATTFQSGDEVDGGGGVNTLRLFMDPGAIADGVKVSNMQVLNLRLNAATSEGPASELVLTDWDRSLQRIDIESNKSELILREQQVIVPISIVDRSTAAQSSSYVFNYAAGVLDGNADAVAFTINNVNGVGGSAVGLDTGVESVSFAVADRAGAQYASNINLVAAGVTSITVTSGLLGQSFTMNADVFSDEDLGASFVSTSFRGDMLLTSADLDTVAFGAGDDTLTMLGRGGEGSSYDLGAGDNTLTYAGGEMAGAVVAANGDNTISVGSVAATGSVTLGNGDNSVTATGAVAGAVVAGNGDNSVSVGSVADTGSITLGGGDNVVSSDGVHAGDITVGDGANLVRVGETALGSTITAGDGGNTIVAGSVAFDADVSSFRTEAAVLPSGVTTVLGQISRSALSDGKFGSDVYKFTHKGGPLTVTASGFDTNLFLFDADGLPLRSDDDDGPGSAAQITADLPAGDYYIAVGANSIAAYAPDEFGNTSGYFRKGDRFPNDNDDVAFELVGWDGGPSSNSNNGDYTLAFSVPTGGTLPSVGAAVTEADLVLEPAAIIAGGAHEGAIVTGSGNDDVVVGATGEDSSIDVGAGDNRVIIGNAVIGSVTGDVVDVTGAAHSGSLVAGDGDNLVAAGSVTEGSMAFGDGTNTVAISGSVFNGSISFGDGDGNSLTVGEDVVAEEPGTITFGDGDGNTLTIGNDLLSDAVVFGAGANNSVTIGDDMRDASITVAGTATTVSIDDQLTNSTISLGNGSNVVSVGSVAREGSAISFGNGADQFILGTTGEDGAPDNQPSLGADHDVATTVDMGEGDDSALLRTSGEDIGPSVIRSGSFIDGEGGNDVMRLEAGDSATLIERTDNQVVTVDFSEELFTLGQVITVTFERGDDTFEVDYTVVESDFIQGPEGLAVKVAESIAKQLNDDDAFEALFGATASNGVVTIESIEPLEDFTLSSSVGVVDVVLISDAEITSFETLELVALDGGGEDNITINADFELIEGTNTVKLDSQVERDPSEYDVGLNGTYTGYSRGGVTTFELESLNGGEEIHVTGREASATGNSQVSRIIVDIEENDHVVGDTITVTINDTVVTYVVTAADLDADTGALDANQIATSLAAAIAAAAEANGLTVALDLADEELVAKPQITLVGAEGVKFDINVAHTRFEATEIYKATAVTDLAVDIAALFDTDFEAPNGDWLRPLRADDVITLTVGKASASFTVTDEICDRLETDRIVAFFKAELGIEGDWGDILSEKGGTLTVTRVIDLVENGRTGGQEGDQTTVDTIQSATPTDDGDIDVVLDATLDPEATNTTMDLTIAGEGDFDLAITGSRMVPVNVFIPIGEDFGPENAFTDLELTLADGFDHTIDTGGGQVFTALGNWTEALFNPDAITAFDADDARVFEIRLVDGRIVRLTYEPSDVDVRELVSILVSDTDGANFVERLEEGADVVYVLEDLGEELGVGLLAVPTYEQALRVLGLTVYNGDVDDADTLSQTFGGVSVERLGNFADSITVADQAGVDTTGSTITLENVLAGTVTSTSKANLEIDQYATRLFNNGQAFIGGDVINVTTGSGDDRLDTYAPSALAEGSSINLGAGNNTLALGWGEGVVLRHFAGDITEDPQAAVQVAVNTQTQFLANSNQPGASSDRDFFKVTLEAGKTYQVFLNTVGLEPDAAEYFVDFVVYSDDAFTFAGQSSLGIAGGGAVFTLSPTASGDYYIRTQASAGAPLSGSQVLGLEIIESPDPVTEFQYDTGSPALSLVEREQVVPVSLDFSEMSYTGTLAVFELLNNVDALAATPLVMPGRADKVGELKVQDFNLGGDLTIVGAANDFTITADTDFDVVGHMVIKNAAGAQITGSLVINADPFEDGDIDVNLANAELASVKATADDNIDVRFSANEDAEIVVGDVDLNSVGSSGDAQVSIDDNNSTQVTLGDISVTADDDSDLDIENNSELTATLGNITLLADEDADLNVQDNSKSTITMGSVSITQEDAESSSQVAIHRNEKTDVTMGPLTISVFGGGQDADLDIGNEGGNIGSNITVAGPILIKAQDEAEVNIENNLDTNVSLAVGSTITLATCDSNNDMYLRVNNNRNNHDPLGPDPLSENFIQDYAVTLGDVIMDGGDEIRMRVNNNVDNTYYGDMSVTVGDVSIFAYDYAELDVIGNASTTVVMGSITSRTQDHTEIVIRANEGRIYNNSLANPPRDEPDFATVTIDDITVDTDEDAYMGIGDNAVADITTGDVTMTADRDAGVEILYNDGSLPVGNKFAGSLMDVTLGDVTLEGTRLVGVSIGLNASNDSDLLGSSFGANDGGNINSAIDLGAVDITSTGTEQGAEANVVIANNRGANGRGSVDMDSVTTSSATSTNFFVYNNTLTGVLDMEGDSAPAINVGDVSMAADRNANLAITDNGEQLNGWSVRNGEDAGPTTMAFGDITLTAGEGEDSSSDWNAQVDITGNAVTELTAKDVTLSGVNTGLFVNDNGNSEVTLEDVSLTSTGEGDYVADVTVNNNFATDVTMGDVTISSDEDALIEVDGNYDTIVTFQGPVGEDVSTVTMGNVDVDADGDARFFITDNSDTEVTIAMDDEADDGRGTIDIDAATIGQFGEDAEGFNVLAGEDVTVTLGHISLTAAGKGTVSDVDFNLGVGPAGIRDGGVLANPTFPDPNLLALPSVVVPDTSSIDTGDITINADGDVYATLFGGEDSLTVGDIVINSGLEPEDLDKDGEVTNPNVSSDIFFTASRVQGNAKEDGDQSISLSAGSRGRGEGNVYGRVFEAPDLTTLTVAGTNAELYLSGDISTDTPDTTEFTLDLSALVGSFGSNEEGTIDNDPIEYDRLGVSVSDNLEQDDGSYVETYAANFGRDIVRVVIGSGDLIYNAEHSSWGEDSDANDWGSPWDEPEHGWLSLGSNGDFAPVAQTQVISGFAVTSVEQLFANTSQTFYNALQFEQDGQSYRAQVSVLRADGPNILPGDDTFTYNDTPTYFKLVNGSWTEIAQADLEAELGIDSISYARSGDEATLTFTGGPDGTPFADVTGALQVKLASTDSNVDSSILDLPIPRLISNSNGNPAEDNWGQDAKETFTFTGDSVGVVVIGGFSAGDWGRVNPDNGRLTDRLDFSKFDWNGDGVANDAGLVDLSYFEITVDDSDGYFKDVVIKFIGGANVSADSVDFGEIRLVGAGEFDDPIERVSDSFVFG